VFFFFNFFFNQRLANSGSISRGPSFSPKFVEKQRGEDH